MVSMQMIFSVFPVMCVCVCIYVHVRGKERERHNE